MDRYSRDLMESYQNSQDRMLEQAAAMDAAMQPQREFLQNARRVAEAADAQLHQAEDAVADLVEMIEAFEASISPGEEVRLVIVGGPSGTMFFPERIEASGGDRIVYSGTDNQRCRVKVIQHVSQMNVMVKAAKVMDGPARRIGFHSEREDEPA